MSEFKPEEYEAARWGQDVDATTKKFVDTGKEVLADAAGRGFSSAPGATLKAIQEVAVAAKTQLTDANAKLYEEQMQRALKEEEVEQKQVFGLAKLDVEAYKADVENALSLEKAESELTLDERKALIENLKSDVDKRQAAIIEERADIEHEVNYWKLQAIEAEGLAIDAELQLAREKVKTAEEKMKVINVLYEVIAAEQLVLLAEQRKAAALQKVVEAEKQVAAIQKTMIPYMVQKADARMLQAEVVKEEADAKKQIEELGYRRIELKAAQEDADHQLRLAELSLEEARGEVVKWNNMTELAKIQSRTALVKYETTMRDELLPREESLRKEEKRFDIARRLFWDNYETTNDIKMLDLTKRLTILEAQKRITQLIALAQDKRLTIMDTTNKYVYRASYDYTRQYIAKG